MASLLAISTLFAGANFSNTIGFHEGSSWNYTFFVPHDIEGLIKVMGGSKRFVERLEWVFENGHYDPTNEPDIAYPYLFSRVKGYEYLTQDWVKRSPMRTTLPSPMVYQATMTQARCLRGLYSR